MPKTFALHTLGCKVNQCDGDALAAELTKAGYAAQAFDAVPPADIFIVNTCTVTHTVDKKSMQTVRRARKANPAAFIAVCGCMAAKSENDIPEADFVFDSREPERLLAELEQRFGAPQEVGRVYAPAKTRAFLKVQDGCDQFCAYCIVPYVRGQPVGLPLSEILLKAAAYIQQGAKEIVLTGIQLASYGKNDSNGHWESALPQLVRQVGALPGLSRLRLSSLDPRAINDEFLQAAEAAPALCDHFHLSLQSGCDTTLKRMNRRYTTAEYETAAEKLRGIFPQSALTTDIIVGFPGESDGDFAESMTFAEKMRFARIHVFPYSPRAGTAAAGFPNPVSAPVKKERNQLMLALAARLQVQFLTEQLHKTVEILMETPVQGHTRNYCMVHTVSPAAPNTLREVRITDHDGKALKGV